MKITDYVSNLTKREAGKEQVTVAQMAEILKKVNADLWGVPYLLIKLKRSGGKVAAVAALALCAWALSGCATLPAECQDNHRPVAVIKAVRS